MTCLSSPLPCSHSGSITLGANRGLGLAASRHFAIAGANVIMACRSGIPTVGQSLSEEVGEDAGKISMMHLDLSSPSSARSAATQLQAQNTVIDYVVLNAAIVDGTSVTSKDCPHLSRMFVVNYLTNTVLIKDLLRMGIFASSPGKVSTLPRLLYVSSGSYWHGAVDSFGAESDWTALGAMHFYVRMLFNYFFFFGGVAI